ncbi:MAG TPA: pirin family protein [Sandaracinaceae bacterium LLY-WYZ-13_1]|nr:pirin family protein [Sandaracinaceae bacterium LLY-WYZ-13_1]
MIRIRRAEDRGQAEHGWLRSAHSFSFAGYFDPEHVGFRTLRVLNEDRVAPGAGFPPHGHRDMEIVSYVVDGAMSHEDSTGAGSVIRPGDVQRMTAGTGVLHSEYNASDDAPLHFLQIWILPARAGLPPSHEQRHFPEAERAGALRLLVSPDGADGSLGIHQDVRLFGALLSVGDAVEHRLAEGRHAWVQVVRGAVTANGSRLQAGDGAAISEEAALVLRGEDDAELLLFDLA